MAKAILVMGYPASGKSTIVKPFEAQGWEVFNRDRAGGKVASLVPGFKAALEAGRSVVADNLFLTAESRAPFIRAAQEAGVEIECHWMLTSFEDSQVNALHRMWDRYQQVFLTAADIKAHPEAKADPKMFPIAAMYAHKKRLNGDKKKGIPSGKPSKAEGFSRIVKVPFVRRPFKGTKRAIIFDYDGTLRADAREHGGAKAYPCKPSEVVALPNRTEVIQRYVDEGFMLLGVTTQSGVGKGDLTEDDVKACIAETNRQVGHDIEAVYCPHHNFPVSCYCRKPQAGLGIHLIRTYDLDPEACIYVGDQTSDRNFAIRCGFKYADEGDFFKAG
jgi:D-glycero-D-manno-heptose 1,7-bisphosphate phosphatase